MPDFLSKYRELFSRLERKTEPLRNHGSMIRDHFGQVGEWMAKLNLRIFVETGDFGTSATHGCYLTFDNIDRDLVRKGRGRIAVITYRLESGRHVIDQMIEIEDAPYPTLIRAYAKLPDLIHLFVSSVSLHLEESPKLEEMINKFRDSADPLVKLS